MAKFTKTRARKPLAEGQLSTSYSHLDESVTLYVRADTEVAGKPVFFSLDVTLEELEKAVAFAQKARSEAKNSGYWN